MSKTFQIITLGCKVNQGESASLREALIQAGWLEVPKGGKAALNIVNTCIVTQSAAYQSRQAIRRLVKETPGALTAAVGCYAQVFPEHLKEIRGLGVVAGNRAKLRLPELLDLREKGSCPVVLPEDSPSSPFPDVLPVSDRTRAMLKVQDGCDSFCTYCIVPYARGPVRSLDPQKVIDRIEALSERGYKEVVLTGIHLGRYGSDLKASPSLKDLLSIIGKRKTGPRIRLSSLEPKELTLELIEMTASEPWLCRHFHIPLQSGDDRILKRMNRPYTREDFTALVEAIHAKIPGAAIGVDILAGFPGEDEEAHLATYDLVRELPLSYVHVFPFSPRKGTPAWTFTDRVPVREIRKRAAELRSLGEKKRKAFYESCVGKTFEVLSEGWDEERQWVSGLSDNYVPVSFPSSGPCLNEMVRVRIERVDGKRVHGTRRKAHGQKQESKERRADRPQTRTAKRRKPFTEPTRRLLTAKARQAKITETKLVSLRSSPAPGDLFER